LISDWKTPRKQSANLAKHSGRLKKFPQSIFGQEESFQVQTALLSFTVNALGQLPSVNFDMSNLRSAVTHK